MPRLKNKATGSVVNVSDAKAARLSSEWELSVLEKPKARTKKTDVESDS
jgi:hypothetical protein